MEKINGFSNEFYGWGGEDDDIFHRIEDAKCERETSRAILVSHDDLGELWIPKSCVHDDSEVFGDGDLGDLVVKSWWAEKQGWV